MEVRALASDQPVSPQKVRLVLAQIKGLQVSKALALLEFMPQPSARMVHKVVRSAAANAENNFGADVDALKVGVVFVDEARTLKRMRARAKGRGNRISKRTCHITLKVSDGE